MMHPIFFKSIFLKSSQEPLPPIKQFLFNKLWSNCLLLIMLSFEDVFKLWPFQLTTVYEPTFWQLDRPNSQDCITSCLSLIETACSTRWPHISESHLNFDPWIQGLAIINSPWAKHWSFRRLLYFEWSALFRGRVMSETCQTRWPTRPFLPCWGLATTCESPACVC